MDFHRHASAWTSTGMHFHKFPPESLSSSSIPVPGPAASLLSILETAGCCGPVLAPEVSVTVRRFDAGARLPCAGLMREPGTCTPAPTGPQQRTWDADSDEANMKDIVTLTVNPAIDISTTVKRVAPNRKLRCGPPRREPGGGGLNVSRALLRLGGDSLAFYTAGGPTGRMLAQLLEEEGISCRPLEREGWTRESLAVREEEEDDQYRFNLQGPEMAEGEWKACLEELAGLDPAPKFLVASGSLPPGVPTDFYARVAEVARDLEARLILDTSGDALKEGLEGGVFLVKPNLRELASLTGGAVPEPEEDSDFEEEQADAARELVERGKAEAVLVSMGSAGALLVTEDETERIPSPTVRIRSRVGAGDSMVAGVALGLSRDFELPRAALLGVAAGAAAVMTSGTELCRRRDAEAIFRRMVDGSW